MPSVGRGTTPAPESILLLLVQPLVEYENDEGVHAQDAPRIDCVPREDGATDSQIACLLIDCWKVWATHEFSVWVAEIFRGDIILRFVDARMTSIEQPLDVQLQSYTKGVIKTCCEDYLCEATGEQTGMGIPPGQVRLDLALSGLKAPWVGWVNEARDALAARPDFVRSAWTAALIGSETLRDPATVVRAQRAKREGKLGGHDEPPTDVEDDTDHMPPHHEEEDGGSGDLDAEVGMATVDEVLGESGRKRKTRPHSPKTTRPSPRRRRRC